MKVNERKCIKKFYIEDQEGSSLTLEKGKIYTTGPVKDGKMFVFSRYWVVVPTEHFDMTTDYIGRMMNKLQLLDFEEWWDKSEPDPQIWGIVAIFDRDNPEDRRTLEVRKGEAECRVIYNEHLKSDSIVVFYLPKHDQWTARWRDYGGNSRQDWSRFDITLAEAITEFLPKIKTFDVHYKKIEDEPEYALETYLKIHDFAGHLSGDTKRYEAQRENKAKILELRAKVPEETYQRLFKKYAPKGGEQ